MDEKDFLSILIKYNKILIYGAGMVGGLVYNRVCAAGMEDKIKGFLVTKKQFDEKHYLDKPIWGIEEINGNKSEQFVIIATLPELHSVMENMLKEHGFMNFMKVDENIFRLLSQCYVNDFEKKWKRPNKEIDIVFMASDNNRSSGAFLALAELNNVLNQKGVSTLVVLPEYGNGEKILLDRKIQYTYILSEHWAIKDEEECNTDKEERLQKNEYAVCKLVQLIQEFNVKLIHNNTTYTYVGALAAKECNIPCVWHIREKVEDQGNKFVNKEKAMECINSVDKIITISHFMKEHVEGLDESKVEIVYDGIDVDKVYIGSRPILNKREITITIVGVLLPYKGQHELIQAAGILLERGYSDFKIRIVGNDVQDYTQTLHTLVNELGLEQNVEFLGRQDNMKRIYSQTDIAVSCSPIEPFGRVTIEGQLSGSLAIGIDSGATAELIKDGETGLLYKGGKPESLANCIIEAIYNLEKSREIACNGQKYARQKFTQERNAEEIIRVYQKILKNKLML